MCLKGAACENSSLASPRACHSGCDYSTHVTAPVGVTDLSKTELPLKTNNKPRAIDGSFSIVVKGGWGRSGLGKEEASSIMNSSSARAKGSLYSRAPEIADDCR